MTQKGTRMITEKGYTEDQMKDSERMMQLVAGDQEQIKTALIRSFQDGLKAGIGLTDLLGQKEPA